MKKQQILLLAFILISNLYTLSCSPDLSKGGIKGVLKYGEGSCLFDPNTRYYYNYNGMVYFVAQHTRDTFSGSYNNILNISDSLMINNGNFSKALDPGTYYVCIREHLVFNEDNMFSVNLNQTTEKTFWIFKCI